MRSQPLGCQVSTLTTITTGVTVVSTLAVVLVLHILFLICRYAARGKSRRGYVWRRRSLSRTPEGIPPLETDPLLSNE